jgi:hypothetical protein
MAADPRVAELIRFNDGLRVVLVLASNGIRKPGISG